MRPMEVHIRDGEDLPEELQQLPEGRYELRPVDAPTCLSPDQDTGLHQALRQLDAGQGVPHEQVVARWRDRLSR